MNNSQFSSKDEAKISAFDTIKMLLPYLSMENRNELAKLLNPPIRPLQQDLDEWLRLQKLTEMGLGEISSYKSD